MRYPLFLCMLVSVLLISSCGNDKQNTDDPENPDNPSGKIELWNKDKIVRFESKYENTSSSRAYTYDSQGRETAYFSYINGDLDQEYKNYSYNGLVCTYDVFRNGVYESKTTIEFYDESWNRGKIRSSLNSDILAMRAEYQYNDQGKLIGIKNYTNNALSAESNNYRYDIDRWGYDYHNYGSSPYMMTYKIEYTYSDTKTIKRKYTNDSYPMEYQEWEYDAEGREINYKTYRNGIIISEYKNYVYNGKICTFDVFTNGTKTSTVLIEYY